jgi:MOSC domain-containing protein YiiM
MSTEGRVASLHIAPTAGAAMQTLERVRAVAGRGLEGDRYFNEWGTYSKHPGTGRDITLIESEAIEALKREYGVEIAPGQARRNIVTRAVALNHLVGREFTVGEVRLRGARLCEPCAHLERLSIPGTRPGLILRGGLRAEVLSGGMIRVGDTVAEFPDRLK